MPRTKHPTVIKKNASYRCRSDAQRHLARYDSSKFHIGAGAYGKGTVAPDDDDSITFAHLPEILPAVTKAGCNKKTYRWEEANEYEIMRTVPKSIRLLTSRSLYSIFINEQKKKSA